MITNTVIIRTQEQEREMLDYIRHLPHSRCHSHHTVEAIFMQIEMGILSWRILRVSEILMTNIWAYNEMCLNHIAISEIKLCVFIVCAGN